MHVGVQETESLGHVGLLQLRVTPVFDIQNLVHSLVGDLHLLFKLLKVAAFFIEQILDSFVVDLVQVYLFLRLS